MPEHTFCKIFSLNRSITLEFQKLVMQSWNIGCFDLGSTESRLHIQLDLEPEHQGMANSALTGRTYIWYNLQQIIAHLLGQVVLEKNIMKLLLFPAAVNIHHSSCLWDLKTKILVSGQHKMHLKHASTCLKQAQAGLKQAQKCSNYLLWPEKFHFCCLFDCFTFFILWTFIWYLASWT